VVERRDFSIRSAGSSRRKKRKFLYFADEIGQGNDMKKWKKGKEFLEKPNFDCEVITSLFEAELRSLFEYSCYLKHIDGIFARLG